ncbi:unnamed protein product [Orchesella dallaii]|uniref:Gustatory receptor n=1 Tax=Orchesella dallaii TaxID=48710 RepID=A0ABP1QHM9_9HEXA
MRGRFARQRRHGLDLEMQSQTADPENRNLRSDPSTAVPIQHSPVENENSLVATGAKRYQSYFEIFLNFYHFIGISPILIYNGGLKSTLLKKVSSILIILLAMTYSVFDIRRLSWGLDEEYNDDLDAADRKPLQQAKASKYIGLVYQFALLLLDACIFRLMWCKEMNLMKLFSFLDIQKITGIFKSSFNHILTLLISVSSTIPISFICTVGGLNINIFENFSFTKILQDQESVLLLGLKKSYDTATDYNISSGTNATTEGDDYSGIFLNDGALETIIFGTTGLAMHFCQHVVSLVSYDFLLLTTIGLWIPTKPLGEQLQRREYRCTRRTLGCNLESETPDIVNDIVQQHKELYLLSKHINSIINSIFPALVFICIISTSYFMHNCVIRKWSFAILLALKLSKVCVAMYFAMKTSSVAQGYFAWFMSEEMQQVLDLDCKQLQRKIIEMKENPVGVGSSVFYVDLRFMLSVKFY